MYYANTDRNKAAGKTPDTVVSLPGIDGFKPNNNKNPQQSDASGAYGFMVFPKVGYIRLNWEGKICQTIMSTILLVAINCNYLKNIVLYYMIKSILCEKNPINYI